MLAPREDITGREGYNQCRFVRGFNRHSAQDAFTAWEAGGLGRWQTRTVLSWITRAAGSDERGAECTFRRRAARKIR